MAAYNFQSRFAERIKNGSKKQTIRRVGKRRHAKPGEKVQLYTGMRTKNCRKIISDPTCLHVRSIQILVGAYSIGWIKVDGKKIPKEQLEEFAIADGFDSIQDMHGFWLKFHGQGIFGHSEKPEEQAVLVSWD